MKLWICTWIPLSWIPNRLTQGYVGAPILIGHAKKHAFTSPTPLFVYGQSNIKQTWACVNSCKLMIRDYTHGFILFYSTHNSTQYIIQSSHVSQVKKPETTKAFTAHAHTHHTVITIVIVVTAMLTLCYSIVSHGYTNSHLSHTHVNTP